MSDLRFVTASKSVTQSERALFFSIWARKEHDILVALLARGQELAPQPKI